MYVVMNSERVKELWEEKGCYSRGRASEANRTRLRWPSAFSGQNRELLGADGTWVCGIGRLWGVRLIFGRAQRKPWLSLAPKQQVHTGDQVLQLLV